MSVKVYLLLMFICAANAMATKSLQLQVLNITETPTVSMMDLLEPAVSVMFICSHAVNGGLQSIVDYS